MNKKTILIAEDDLILAKVLQKVFEEKDFKVYHTDDGVTALKIYDSCDPAILLLDIDLPEKSGWEVMELIREKNKLVPIVIMSGHKIELNDSLKSYDIGATHYVRKPFYEEEIVALIASIVARTYGYMEIISIGNCQLNMSSFYLQVNSKIYQLKEKEAKVLYLLGKNQNQIVETEQILELVWHHDSLNNLQMLRNLIVELRKSLQEVAEIKIKTVHKKGYMMDVLK